MRKNRRGLFLAQSALFAALLCLLAPIAVPVGPVPITLGTFVVMLCGAVLDWRRAAAAVGVYLLMGAIGLPVFSGGRGGFGALIGPTGGYLWSYLPMAVVVSRMAGGSLWRSLTGCILALGLCYLLGSWQFACTAQVGWGSALKICVLPFVPFDLAKAACAGILGLRLKRRLRQAELL